jgi:hypothetical protein
MESLDASRDLPSKSQPQEKSPRGSKLSIEQVESTVSVRFRKFSVFFFSQCFDRQLAATISPVASLAACFPCSFFLSRVARTAGVFLWSPVSWQGLGSPVSDGSDGRCGRQRAQRGATPFSTAQTTPSLRVAILFAGTHRRTVAVAWDAQSTPSAADAPASSVPSSYGVPPKIAPSQAKNGVNRPIRSCLVALPLRPITSSP